MSQTASTECSTPSIRIGFNYDFYQYRVHQIREAEIANGLVVGLYGMEDLDPRLTADAFY